MIPTRITFGKHPDGGVWIFEEWQDKRTGDWLPTGRVSLTKEQWDKVKAETA